MDSAARGTESGVINQREFAMAEEKRCRERARAHQTFVGYVLER